MAESNVLKILYVLDMLKRTDEQHPINSTQIIEKLEELGFKAGRKSIGHYIEILTDEMHYSIQLHRNRNLGWYMCDQDFEDYELKMLVDAVSSAKFLTAKNTRDLVGKIRNLATKEGDRIIKAGFVMDESLKLVDSQFALKFDMVMRAIADHRQIRFQYQEIGPGGKPYTKKDGAIYQISPYYLGIWKQEYFVIANTSPYDNVTSYRIEMMINIEETDEKARPMSEINELKNVGQHGYTFGDYFKESVNLRSGQVKSIKISGINHLRREVMKQFGNNLMFRDQGLDRFLVNISVADSPGFYQWLAQFGKNMKIEGPEECINHYKDFLREALEQYLD